MRIVVRCRADVVPADEARESAMEGVAGADAHGSVATEDTGRSRAAAGP